ncbi:MAG TPA: ROK family protein [Candidatus Binatia bacterium]|nr:ROK family protein [Candidatus Binatia bacterium]
MKTFLGIEIGGSKLQLFLGDESAKVLERIKLPVDPESGGEGIRAQISEALPKLSKYSEVAGLAVGFGGPVDRLTGRIARSHQIEGWSDFPLQTWLHDLSAKPVLVDNDANMAALGEALHGAGKGADPVFYVTLGSGVGGGLVVNGEIYHGAAPGESEIGHLRLDQSGTIVEDRCSGWAVDRKTRELVKSGRPSLLIDLIGKATHGEARFLAKALEAKDAEAERILGETAGDLAFALSHVTQLFHPQVIVIGGGLSLLGEPLRAAVASALPRHIMTVFGQGPTVRLAGLGEDSVPVGCLAAAAKSHAHG